MKTTSPLSLRKSSRRSYLAGAIVTAALALASLTAASAQTGYTVTELAIPAGCLDAVPYSINDQGFLTGYAQSAIDQDATAVIWKNGVPTVLGRLKKGLSSIAMAMNSKGVVAGDGDDGDGRPLGWVTSGSSLVNYFSNNGGNTHSLAINDLGEVGGYYIKGFDSVWHGGIWKIDPKDPRKTTLFTLPSLPGGDPATSTENPWAFNKKNEAAGWAGNNVLGQHAVFWGSDAAHSIVDLGVFGSDWSSTANGLNDLGQVVGQSNPPVSGRAVLWQNDAAHTCVELPLLPGDNYGQALLINNQGVIVGLSSYLVPGTWSGTPSRTVVWIQGVPNELNTLLRAPAGTWTNVTVTSINSSGQMAALAMRNGVLRGVVLTPVY